MMLTRLAVAVAAFSLVTGVAAMPALASTSQGTITISSITTHIMSGTDDLLDVSNFVNTNHNKVNGIWQVATPIPEGNGPGQLPFGSYAVTVDVSDADGDSASISGVGGLDLQIDPVITLSLNPPTFSYLHQSAQISGNVTGYWPDGSSHRYPGSRCTSPTQAAPCRQTRDCSSGPPAAAATTAAPSRPTSRPRTACLTGSTPT